MISMQLLNERFLEKSQRPMTFGVLPISPQEAEVPVIAVERWRSSNGALHKTYRFRRMEDRLSFVTQLLAYEQEVGHSAVITIDHDEVSLRVTTHDIGKVTELDKEYARFCDLLFRDLAYAPGV